MKKEDFFDASSFQKKKLKIGDSVRFLNSVGGGIVTAFSGKDRVLVKDEDGFETPTLNVECVVVGEGTLPMANIEKKTQTKVSLPTEVMKPEKKPFTETPQGERLNLWLSFLPVEPQSFVKTPFETYLINESNYFLYFNYLSCKNNGWKSRFHGLIEPDTKIFMEEIEKSTLNELEHVCIQLIAFKEEKTFSMKNAFTVELRLDTVKFYKLHCFTKNDFFDEEALIVPVIVNDMPERQMLVSASDIQAAMYDRDKDVCKTPLPVVSKHEKINNKIEVDLHISQLLESTSGLSNADMLHCQLSKFHEVMKAYSTKKGQRIVFIHGKGEGILRAAMEKELKTSYKKLCRFQDASFHEYGFGATMVIIY